MPLRILFLLICIGVFTDSSAQKESIHQTIRATNVQEMFRNRPNFIGGNSVYGIPETPRYLEGNFYLDPNWNRGSILLYKENEILNDFFIRYQIEENYFEVMANQEGSIVKIGGESVRNYISVDSTTKSKRVFINQRDFVFDSEGNEGFFELLVEGQMTLVKATRAIYKNSNYNTALMMGEKNDKIVKRDSYYYIVGDSVYAVSSKMTEFLHSFGDRKGDIRKFINKYNVNIKEELGMIRIFNFFRKQSED